MTIFNRSLRYGRDDTKGITLVRRTSRRGRETVSSCGSVDVRGECEREDCVLA